jgi:hypothetical protein
MGELLALDPPMQGSTTFLGAARRSTSSRWGRRAANRYVVRTGARCVDDAIASILAQTTVRRHRGLDGGY